MLKVKLQFIKYSNEKNVLSLKFILTMDVLIFNSNQKFQNKFKFKAFYLAKKPDTMYRAFQT